MAVIDANQDITGVLSYKNILSAYKTDIEQNSAAGKHLSIKRQTLKMMVKRQNRVTSVKNKS